MSVYFGYIFLGLSLAAPIGPINAAQLDRGIKYGFLHAWFIGIGATLADAAYMLLVYCGLAHFIEFPIVKIFLWLFGGFVLIYTGIESVINVKIDASTVSRSYESLFKSFISGFFMSIFNPLTILFWLGIYGSVLAKTAATVGTQELLLCSATIFIGVLLWDVTMAAFSSTFRRFLNVRVLNIIALISGCSLIGYGLYFGYQAYHLLLG
ncbi:threonine/homoserine/homoserine lactone efflux protein [Pullulanibacillus pueri]|uniref:Amino acid transporter n=1 Tax=Pullulanibacillus pueri TaxID=1437324 RepID=A0A8J2ZRY1_9BACL|nr:LysE family transporter [Pullulanibacillus pueri]MBM7680026.1 threonine/homoserine/homoserine lactone efflux protein [Pullulanibacillus pueri]GGH73999.1 amino acid transporter [Pullulanibacillus pueri]